MKAIIVEDSRLARQELKELLKSFPSIEVISEAANIQEGKEQIEKNKPDVIFLDINMPGGSGFDLLESLSNVPSVIFTTAYNEYAVRAFEVNALDYLLKPISQEHLEKAISKLQVESPTSENSKPIPSDSKIFVKDGDACWLIKIGDIRYFESIGNHTRIFFEDKKPFIYKSLNKACERLPSDLFLRANRQFVININFVNHVEPIENGRLLLTMDDKKEIEVSRRSAIDFKRILSL